MVASVLQWFGFRRVDGRTAGPSAYAEALQAGWVPPPPELQARPGPGRPAVGEKPDIVAFLARVYLNQRC